jgi:hypothetical protein
MSRAASDSNSGRLHGATVAYSRSAVLVRRRFDDRESEHWLLDACRLASDAVGASGGDVGVHDQLDGIHDHRARRYAGLPTKNGVGPLVR